MNAHKKTAQELAEEFSTNLDKGLSEAEAAQRLRHYGYNVLPERKPESWLILVLRQFKSPLVYVLCIAALIVLIAGMEKYDALIIVLVLLINALIGAIQEGRAQNILEGLRKLAKTTSIVIRDGHELLVDDMLLVPGDIIVIQDGNKVPADARILEAHNLRVDEAMLTGESESVVKTALAMKHDVPIYERKNMIFKGTYITAGTGRALVVDTGVKTQIGAIQESIEGIDTDMPLKREIDRISRLVIVLVMAVCVIFFAVGLLYKIPIYELFMIMVALFVSAVPEGLPIVLTITLAVGAHRLARRNALIKRMQAVEGLGRTNVIIIDKTGTLTRNELMVSRVLTSLGNYEITGEGYFDKGQALKDGNVANPIDDEHFKNILMVCAFLSHAQFRYDKVSRTFEVKGDPTNAALSVLAKKFGVNRDNLERQRRRLFEIPFDSAWQYHAIFVEHEGAYWAYVIGSTDVLCARSVDNELCNAPEAQDMFESGLRVLAVAIKPFDAALFGGLEENFMQIASQFLERDVKIVGLLGLNDAIRHDVAESIAAARSGGIRVIMATGDHKKTARFVAEKTGILQPNEQVMTGKEVDRLSDIDLYQSVASINAYARVIPQQKMRIVRALQERGELVAMTGDGVNDAPALIAANLGIAMGGIGTEVAKQAADIVLLDDSFNSIVEAIKLGRHIFYTLRRVVLYFFATNFGEILIILAALIMRLPLPLTAVQILWLNLVTDGFLDVALALEPLERGLLRDRWFLQKPALIDSSFIFKMFFMAFPMVVCSLLCFYFTYEQDLVYARSFTLLVMASFQWFNAWNCRSETKSIIQLGLFANRWLLLATGIVVGLQLALYNTGFMQHFFKVVPLSARDWLIALALAFSVILLEEGRKKIVKLYKKKHHAHR